MFKFEKDKCYRMPAHFGGFPYQPAELCYHDVITMIFSYKTDGKQLSNYIPESFELLQPEVKIVFSQCREIDWMAGSAYNLVSVSVPVRFNGKRDQIEGSFSLVTWENKTAPILGGREETGVSKIFADIEDIHIFHNKRFSVASHEGNSFLHVEMTVESELDDGSMSKYKSVPSNSMHWRYIPKVGAPGADVSQAVLYPQRSEAEKVWQGTGNVRWTKLSYEQCPNQFHIIYALSELPVIEVYPTMLTQGALFLMPPSARVLE